MRPTRHVLIAVVVATAAAGLAVAGTKFESNAIDFMEQADPGTPAAGVSRWWIDSTAHAPKIKLNGSATARTLVLDNDSRLTDARTPSSHAASHQNSGADEVATATPGANAIPKAGADGKLASGWLSAVTSITGTANQITVTGTTTPTLSLPQSIATSSTPQFAGIGVNGTAPATGLTCAGQYASTLYGCTTTLDWNNANVQRIVLANGAQTFTFANPRTGGRYLLILVQPASGAAATVNWPNTVVWPAGSAPVLTTTNSKTDVIAFVYDGTATKYYGASSLNY